tara:strand:- start:213 stop:503 length:291 start_codon:yes stop_codon:yes gene_type:complete
MAKKELKISDKKLTTDTKQAIVFRSPARIPDKGLQSLINLDKIQEINIAYYDIAPTELQALSRGGEVNITIFDNSEDIYSLSNEEKNTLMGEITNI